MLDTGQMFFAPKIVSCWRSAEHDSRQPARRKENTSSESCHPGGLCGCPQDLALKTRTSVLFHRNAGEERKLRYFRLPDALLAPVFWRDDGSKRRVSGRELFLCCEQPADWP